MDPKIARGNCPFFIMWKVWANALGAKASTDKRHSDHVAIVRTIILVMYMTTNCFIVAGVIRHWNDVPTPVVQTK